MVEPGQCHVYRGNYSWQIILYPGRRRPLRLVYVHSLTVAHLYCLVDVHDTPEKINFVRVCPWSAAVHLLVSPSSRGGGKPKQIPGCIGSVRAVADWNYEQRRARRNNTVSEHNEVK